MNLGVLFLTLTLSLQQVLAQSNDQWRDTFNDDSAAYVSHGRNPYFILEPGYRLHLKGRENAKSVDLVITVLDETMIVDGVETRVVEERESVDGTVVEISRNFFAIGKRTNNVYYFGEEVDMYKNGKLAGHEGAWQSGASGARFGLMIPGKPQNGLRYYQEIAPDIAMDRAEVISTSEVLKTPAGRFENCLKTEETTPLEPKEKGYKCYAKGVGLVQDAGLVLMRYGFEKK